jgi:hypothetical protein
VAIEDVAGDGDGAPVAVTLADGNGVPNSCAWAGAGESSHQRNASQPPSSAGGPACAVGEPPMVGVTGAIVALGVGGVWAAGGSV